MRSTTLRRVLLLALTIATASGCNQTSYEVTLTPTGDSLSRSLVYSDGGPSSQEAPGEDDQPSDTDPPAEVVRLGGVYDVPPPRPSDGAFRFEGTFTAMPDDVGGHGEFARKETSLGTLYVYVERFRGSYELAEIIESRFEKAETISHLLAHWARTTGEPSPIRDQLERFINEDLQRDLKNLTVLMMMLADDDGEKQDEEPWMQLAQYGAERGYLDLDTVLRAIWIGESDTQSLHLLRQTLVSQLELQHQDQLLQTWPALADPQSFVASLDRAIESTEIYPELSAERQDWSDRADPPTGSALLGSLLMELLAVHLFAMDTVTVNLQCPHEPLIHNGQWQEDDGRLHWELHVMERDSPFPQTPPDLCYAIWSEPDRQFQEAHLGQVLLSGEALATYCSWRVSLAPNEAAEWDRFLESLSGERISESIAAFEFSAAADTSSAAAQKLEEIQTLVERAAAK